MSPKSYRTTISIPQDLKDRMDAVEEPVNWSAVAARAFEAKLSDILARGRGRMPKEDVVKRLKGLQGEEADEDYEDGKEAGREWAEQYATPKELRNLTTYIEAWERDGSRNQWWDVDYSGWRVPLGAAGSFVFAVRPKQKDDRQAAKEFWEEALGEDDAYRCQDPDFLRGFGHGAMEVWEEVRDDLK